MGLEQNERKQRLKEFCKLIVNLKFKVCSKTGCFNTKDEIMHFETNFTVFCSPSRERENNRATCGLLYLSDGVLHNELCKFSI